MRWLERYLTLRAPRSSSTSRTSLPASPTGRQTNSCGTVALGSLVFVCAVALGVVFWIRAVVLIINRTIITGNLRYLRVDGSSSGVRASDIESETPLSDVRCDSLRSPPGKHIDAQRSIQEDPP